MMGTSWESEHWVFSGWEWADRGVLTSLVSLLHNYEWAACSGLQRRLGRGCRKGPRAVGKWGRGVADTQGSRSGSSYWIMGTGKGPGSRRESPPIVAGPGSPLHEACGQCWAGPTLGKK